MIILRLSLPCGYQVMNFAKAPSEDLVAACISVVSSLATSGVQRKCAGHGNRTERSLGLSQGVVGIRMSSTAEAFVKVETVSVKEDLHKRFRPLRNSTHLEPHSAGISEQGDAEEVSARVQGS